MKVILDANVLIAAFAARGLCEAVLEVCIEAHEIVLSDGILQDVEEKLVQKIKLPPGIAKNIRSFLVQQADLVEPVQLPSSICRAPDDLKVLGVVPACTAEVLITGDQDLLLLKRFESARIMTPREFWEENQKA
jgi:uncharacterized protein